MAVKQSRNANLVNNAEGAASAAHSGYQTSEVDKMIYEKSNTYRLHADNLRWTLLGSFIALFSFVFSSLSDKASSFGLPSGWVFFIICFLTNIFLIILAVQNWFYNLFAQFVTECEANLIARKPLRSLESFSQEKGSTINPFHPAFFFALVALCLISGISLVYAFRGIFAGFWVSLLPIGRMGIAVFLFLLNFVLFFLWFKNWDRWVYRPFIRRFSNLFKPAV